MKATDKQITAILNLSAWLKCGDKLDHSCLTKTMIKKTNGLTKEHATKEIGRLIEEVQEVEDEANEMMGYYFGDEFWK